MSLTEKETAALIIERVAMGIAWGAFSLSQDLLLSGTVPFERWLAYEVADKETGGGPPPLGFSLGGVVWRRQPSGAVQGMGFFEFFAVNHEVFATQALLVLKLFDASGRTMPHDLG